MHKDSIVGVRFVPLSCFIPQRSFDDPAVDYAEEMVQYPGMQLEAWLVKAVCKSDTHLLIDLPLSVVVNQTVSCARQQNENKRPKNNMFACQ